MEKKTSIYHNGLIWFGAGISLAEILTGTYLAPLGFVKGAIAILLGHLIGGLLFFLLGLMSARTGKSAMETVRQSFGHRGSMVFSFLNILQLVGWTGIMIYDGALAANGLFPKGLWLWVLVIGFLIVIWILVGITNLGFLNSVAAVALFLLTMVLSVFLFRGKGPQMEALNSTMSFGMALELSVAMPLSWIPLIGDYTRCGKKPLATAGISALTYGVGSSWMYLIGLGAALLLKDDSATGIIKTLGMGVGGLVIILLATVTTTFLDAYSAGVSSKSIYGKINEKWAGITVTILGVLGALWIPLENFTDFLYLIGSVFAPMAAIVISDYFILKKNHSEQNWNFVNLFVWITGFIVYRWLLKLDVPMGSTLLDVGITLLLSMLVGIIFEKIRSRLLKTA